MATILVAEHTAETAEYIAAKLKRQGNIVHRVDNSLDAWRATTQDCYDVLVIDVVMPGIDSFVLAQKALQENPLLQVIFVTGFAAVAMDTLSTPHYAPMPVTTRPFHLREIAARVGYLTGESWVCPECGPVQKANENNVIYANFQGASSTH